MTLAQLKIKFPQFSLRLFSDDKNNLSGKFSYIHLDGRLFHFKILKKNMCQA